MPRVFASVICFATCALFHVGLPAGDWNRFRGPNGNGVDPDSKPTPVKWSPTENIAWSVELPGPGSSSPIIVGEKVFVTSWSGYGTDRGDRGRQENLKRHLTCYHRQTGEKLWDKTVDAYLPEDTYGGMFAENGYATHTPASDGDRVFVFFGKSGVLAFDLKGEQLWKTPVGTESDPMGWGSACSPILYNNLVIVTASAESLAMYGLDKETGKVVWKSPANGLGGTWGTPVLVKVDDKRTDLVLGVPNEIWGYNPETGKMRWYCEALGGRSYCSSVVAEGNVVYAMGDQGNGCVAVKAGGEDDVTKSHVLWTGRDSNRIGTPVAADGKLYYVSNRVAGAVDLKNGTRVFQGRLGSGGSTSTAANDDNGGRRPGGGFGGGGRGGRGGQDYSSPIVADGKLYFVTRNGETHVLKLGDKFEQLATNRVSDSSEEYHATPAVSDGQLFLRSSKRLYCIAETAK